MTVLLDERKPFFKANLHCHSTNSDGRLSVTELKGEFKKRGYSVVAFTDHEHVIDNSAYDDEDFLTVTSCEVAIKEFPEESTVRNFGMRVCHLNLFALDQHNSVTPCYSSIYDHFGDPSIKKLVRHNGEYQRVYSVDGINDIIRRASDAGFLVQYNHPAWSLENATQYLGYNGLFSVEVYNHSCERMGGDSYNILAFDDFLRSGKKIFCTMCDDCHVSAPLDSPQCDAFGGWVMINAARLDYASIMNALQNGNFYASQGPEIYSITIDNGIVSVKTSEAQKISYSTAGRRTLAAYPDGSPLTQAQFNVNGSDGYFRITVTDEYGKTALSQAYIPE